jgi:hypothetical protein
MEKVIGIPVKIIRFMDFAAIPWNKMTTVVTVRDLRTNKEFDVYEHQLRFEGKKLSSAVMAYIN